MNRNHIMVCLVVFTNKLAVKIILREKIEGIFETYIQQPAFVEIIKITYAKECQIVLGW